MTTEQMIRTLEDNKSGFFKMVAMDHDLIIAKLRAAEELTKYLNTKQLTLVGDTLVRRYERAGEKP